MHRYLTGHWAASTYSIGGKREDNVLYLSPEGSFCWATDSAAGRSLRAGEWRHDTEADVLTLSSTDDMGNRITQSWSIRYVTGCEDANTILVLRWVGLAGRNLPILFWRIHLPEDSSWHAAP